MYAPPPPGVPSQPEAPVPAGLAPTADLPPGVEPPASPAPPATPPPDSPLSDRLRPGRPGDTGPGVPAAEQAAWLHCRVLEVSPLLRELVLQMGIHADDGPRPDADALARERRLGELALDELRRAAPVRLGIPLPQDKRLRSLCEAVIADPTRHGTLAAWAAEAGASARTVARLFQDELGTSFGPWRQQVLLGRALTLAAQGRPMGVIASELGYASASAFTAMVRRSVGLPPGRFFGQP